MSIAPPTALDRARTKAYCRLLPLLFTCYVIAYVDRANVAIAKLTMTRDLPGFDNAVIGFGAGVFFLGYFLLEIPGTLLVEKWSARKWISRIMISWGIVAALTAAVRTPWQFYTVRFFLGLAEAGFFPGVIVYLTHWFPARDRARALSWFLIATPIAQITSPKLSNLLLKIGTDEVAVGGPEGLVCPTCGTLFRLGTLDGVDVAIHHPEVWGLEGWQWVYIAWGIPAVVLGVLVLIFLTDRPAQARWLADDERDALESELKRELALRKAGRHLSLGEALGHPKVLLLAAAYFFIVTGSYGVEFFMPSILEKWYHLKLDRLTWLIVIPPIGSLIGQLLVGWNSDRTKERRLHTALPIYLGAAGLAGTLLSQDRLWLTVALFIVALAGLKAYLPAFWTLPSLFLTEAAAAGSIGLINSVGNLGGFLGPYVIGKVEAMTGSFRGGILFLSASMAFSATVILLLGLGRRVEKPEPEPDPLAETLPEPA